MITPRWLYVLAAATPECFGDAQICDETLEQLDPLRVEPGDVVGIGIHTGNALRGYEIGRMVRERGAWVIFGARWDLLPEKSYMWASVQTLRGCQSTAHSALCGAPMVSNRGNAGLMESLGKS